MTKQEIETAMTKLWYKIQNAENHLLDLRSQYAELSWMPDEPEPTPPTPEQVLTDEQATVLDTLSFDRVCVKSAWEAVPGRKGNLMLLRNSGYVRVTDKWFITKAGRAALRMHKASKEGEIS